MDVEAVRLFGCLCVTTASYGITSRSVNPSSSQTRQRKEQHRQSTTQGEGIVHTETCDSTASVQGEASTDTDVRARLVVGITRRLCMQSIQAFTLAK